MLNAKAQLFNIFTEKNMAELKNSFRKGILVFLRKYGGLVDDCDGYAESATMMNCPSVIRRPWST